MPKRNGNTGEDNSGKPVIPPINGAGDTNQNGGTENSNSHSAATAIDPAAIGHNPDTGTGDSGTASGDSGPRKRGRPRGSTNKRTEANKTLDLSGLQGAISTAHLAIAAMAKNPMWALNPQEVQAYAEAVQNVSRHYNVEVQQKTLDHAMLLVVVGGIYGTRIMAMQRMKAMQSGANIDADAAAHAATNVHQFTPQNQPLQ